VANSDLALFTEGHVVIGQVNPGTRRISDFLNMTDREYIEISDAHWHDLFSERAQLIPAGLITMAKSAVQLVIPRDTMPFGAPRVPTQQIRLDMVLPLFSVKGTLHRRVDEPSNLMQLLTGYSRQFLAVSDAHIHYLPNSKFDTQVPLVLMNTRQIRFWAAEDAAPPRPQP
jgi:hypothetical protein